MMSACRPQPARACRLHLLSLVLIGAYSASCGSKSSGWGFQQSFICQRAGSGDLGSWIKRVTPSDGPALAGVGGGGCTPDASEAWLSLGATIGYSLNGPQLPEWFDINFVWTNGTTVNPLATEAERDSQSRDLQRLLDGPSITRRVYLRSRVPQYIVDEARKSMQLARNGALPKQMLHLFFNVRDNDIQMTWVLGPTGGWTRMKYGGWVPEVLSAHTIGWLKDNQAEFVGATQ